MLREIVFDLREIPEGVSLSMYLLSDEGHELRRISSGLEAGTVVRKEIGPDARELIVRDGAIITLFGGPTPHPSPASETMNGTLRIHGLSVDGSVYTAPPLAIVRVLVPPEQIEPAWSRRVSPREPTTIDDLVQRDLQEITEVLLPAIRRTTEQDVIDEIVGLLQNPATYVEARQRIVASVLEPDRLDEDDSFNTLSVPSIALEYRTTTHGPNGQWIVPFYRHVISSLFQVDPKRDEGTGPGRWQLYLYGGGLVPTTFGRFEIADGGGPPIGGVFGMGWTVSLETAQRLRRRWMIPYVGFEIGGVVADHAGFDAGVVSGFHVVSTRRLSVGVFGGWNFATNNDVASVVRGGVFCDVAIQR